jgi:glutamate mutase epsilon subunit
MNTYLQNDSYLICANATCSSTYAATNDYTSPTYATYMEGHDADTGTEHVMIFTLTAPYTVALIPPTIDISFGTQEAIGAVNVGSRCLMLAFEPVCTITIK